MTIANKLLLALVGFLILCLGGGAIYVAVLQHQYSKKIIDLQNAVAQRDKTIEIKDGLYHRLAVQTEDLKNLLGTRDKQVLDLQSELKKRKEELLTTATVVLGLKKEITQLKEGTQTEVPVENGKPARTKVDFHHDFGTVKVDGWTMTNPPQSWVRLGPGKPLRVNVSVSQDKDKAWHAYATSDDPNVGVDIALAGVNPQVLAPKWYEGFGIEIGLGAGTNQSGVGALVALGITYKLKQFTFGPMVWLGINQVVDKYYGLSFTWRPFEKVR